MNTEVMSLDDALASGDQAAIDAAMEAEGHDPFGEQDEAAASDNDPAEKAGATDGSGKPEAKTGGDAEDAGIGDTSDQSDGDDMRKVVKSKDGKHEIPYEVLEQSRIREQKAQERADELQRQLDKANSKVSETQKQLDNAKTQFEDRGLDADEMFTDPDSITEAELKEIEEDYGKGSAQAKLARNMFRLQQEQAANISEQADAQEGSDDAAVQEAVRAFNSNTDLTQWQQSDPDRWDMAQTIDGRLQSDPEWKSKSVAERFAEVAKRTKLAFGDAIDNPPGKSGKDRAKEIIDKTNPGVPDSLSDIGQAPAADKSLAERFAEMSDADREAAMANLSDAQLQQLMDA